MNKLIALRDGLTARFAERESGVRNYSTVWFQGTIYDPEAASGDNRRINIDFLLTSYDFFETDDLRIGMKQILSEAETMLVAKAKRMLHVPGEGLDEEEFVREAYDPKQAEWLVKYGIGEAYRHLHTLVNWKAGVEQPLREIITMCQQNRPLEECRNEFIRLASKALSVMDTRSKKEEE